MAFITEIGAPDKIIRPENQEPKETPIEEPKPIETPIEEPKTDPDVPKEPGEGEEPKTGEEPKEDDLLTFIDNLGGKENVAAGMKMYQALTSPNFNVVGFVDELEKKMPAKLNGIAMTIAEKYTDWLTDYLYDLTPQEIQELKTRKDDFLVKKEEDDEAYIKELEASDDPKDKRMAKALRDNQLYRDQQRKNREIEAKAKAEAYEAKVQEESIKLSRATWATSDEVLNKAGFKLPQITPNKALSNSEIDALLVRGGHLLTFDLHPMGGTKYAEAEENIKNGQSAIIEPLKPHFQNQANSILNVMLGRMSDLLAKERKLAELEKAPALKRIEPPAAGTAAPAVPAGNTNPVTPPKGTKIGSKSEDEWIVERTRALVAQGVLQKR